MNRPVPSGVVDHYREAFERLRPALRGSPARRAAAFARFAELGFPTTREEAWKYTNLRRLETRRFEPAVGALAGTEAPAVLGGCRVVLVNGSLQQPPPAKLAGFRPGQPVSVTATDADGLLRPLDGLGTERFAALNAAFAAPLLLETESGSRSDEVLELTLVTTGEVPTLASPRIVVHMARDSRARLLIDHVDDGSAHEHFTNAVLDVELAPGAELHLYRVQRTGGRAFHVERIDARVAEQAKLVVRDCQLGGSLARLDLRVALDGRAAAVEATGVFLADGSRHLDTHVLVEHRAVETNSLQDYRGIAANKGRGVFNGKAIVHVGAQKSNARQVNRNLLLTPGAEIDTKPDLEIYADDVQCSHGATTGQLDPAAFFYLRSRGLDEAEARSALTRAFAGAVLARIDEPTLSALVHEQLDARLLRLLEGAS